MNVMVIQEGINFKHAEITKGNGRVEFFIDFDYNFLNEEGSTYSEADFESGWEYDFIVRNDKLSVSRTKLALINYDDDVRFPRKWIRNESKTEQINISIHKNNEKL